MTLLLLLYDTSVVEVNVSDGLGVCLVCVRTAAALLDKLLQLTLSQLLIQLLNRLPSVLVDAGDIILPTTCKHIPSPILYTFFLSFLLRAVI